MKSLRRKRKADPRKVVELFATESREEMLKAVDRIAAAAAEAQQKRSPQQ